MSFVSFPIMETGQQASSAAASSVLSRTAGVHRRDSAAASLLSSGFLWNASNVAKRPRTLSPVSAATRAAHDSITSFDNFVPMSSTDGRPPPLLADVGGFGISGPALAIAAGPLAPPPMSGGPINVGTAAPAAPPAPTLPSEDD